MSVSPSLVVDDQSSSEVDLQLLVASEVNEVLMPSNLASKALTDSATPPTLMLGSRCFAVSYPKTFEMSSATCCRWTRWIRILSDEFEFSLAKDKQ